MGFNKRIKNWQTKKGYLEVKKWLEWVVKNRLQYGILRYYWLDELKQEEQINNLL